MLIRFAVVLVSVSSLFVAPVGWMAIARDDSRSAERAKLPEPSLTVASLNIAKETNADKIVHEISAAPAIRDSDVLFLQEVVCEKGSSVAQDVAERLARQVTFASPDPATAATTGGVAILSRNAIRDVTVRKLKAENLVFRSRHRIALAATVDTPVGTIRAVTAHLDTRINPGERLVQLQPAIDEAQAFSGPSIIGGDFNTNDMQWVSNIVPVPFPGWQASRVRALMASKGFHTPFETRRATFDHLGMQLDWIYTNTLRAAASGIVPLDFSDHHAIWTQFTTRAAAH